LQLPYAEEEELKEYVDGDDAFRKLCAWIRKERKELIG